MAAGGSTSCTSTTTELLQNPGFDSGQSVWVQATNSTSPMITEASTVPMTAQSSPYIAWLGGLDNASESLSQTVTVPASMTSATFSFYYYIDTAETSLTDAYDMMNAQITDATGVVLLNVVTLSNLDTTTAWTRYSVTLNSSYAGRTIIVRFSDTTDSSNPTDFFIDTVSLLVTSCT